MSSKFLSSDSATSLASLQDGTFNLYVASAELSDLTPGLPVKTNADKKLVSGLIEPDEINATLLTNPLARWKPLISRPLQLPSRPSRLKHKILQQEHLVQQLRVHLK